eukprot:SAG31_NODE_2674_length_5267_cov_13.467492_6_plen_238_part_00
MGGQAVCDGVAAVSLAEAAQRICPGRPIAAVLDALRLPADAARGARDLMAPLGLETAQDLQFLQGSERDVEELMHELSAGGLALGHRAKVRLLLKSSDPRHFPGGRPSVSPSVSPSGSPSAHRALLSRRNARRNAHESTRDPDTLSSDTIAMLLSVTVGVLGYLVQAHTARRGAQMSAVAAREQQVPGLSLSLVFCATIRGMRDFHREICGTDRESVCVYRLRTWRKSGSTSKWWRK